MRNCRWAKLRWLKGKGGDEVIRLGMRRSTREEWYKSGAVAISAASVFESCNIVPRHLLSRQIVAIAAQGKTDPNQNTGISIQMSAIYPPDDPSAPSYLGRPSTYEENTFEVEESDEENYIEMNDSKYLDVAIEDIKPTGWDEDKYEGDPLTRLLVGH
ncbi:hypothetical protein LguiA_033874 [Lonicera macranthoides]